MTGSTAGRQKVLWKLDKLSFAQMRLLVDSQNEAGKKFMEDANRELSDALADIERGYGQTPQYDGLDEFTQQHP